MRGALGQPAGCDCLRSAAIPFGLRGRTIGVLVLMSEEAGFFDAASEVGLLDEMGLDISFALDAMATEAERKQADEALRESEQQYRGLFESSPVAMSLERSSATPKASRTTTASCT